MDPRIVESLRSAYNQRTSRGELLSTDRLQSSYAAFRVRFGPDALRSLDGPALLQVMHAHGNRESLVYWLEFKNDDEFPGADVRQHRRRERSQIRAVSTEGDGSMGTRFRQ